MSQREAFEAAIRKSYQSQQVASEVLERMDSGRYVVDSIEYRWEGFQLAIQHARDVAHNTIETIDDGDSPAYRHCQEAIKEGLK